MDYDMTDPAERLRRAEETTRARIPPAFRAAQAGHPAVAAWCQDIIAARIAGDPDPDPAVPVPLPAPPPLLLTGPPGVGKTWEAYGAIRRIAGTGLTLRWEAVTAADLFAELRPRDGGDSQAGYQRYAGCDLLLLDDLGATRASPWTEEVLDRLVNHRHAWQLPVIFTTNLPVRPTEHTRGPTLRDVMSARVYSRLAACVVVSDLGGDDGTDRRVRAAR